MESHVITTHQGGFEKKKKSFLIGPEWSGTSLQQLRQSLVDIIFCVNDKLSV